MSATVHLRRIGKMPSLIENDFLILIHLPFFSLPVSIITCSNLSYNLINRHTYIYKGNIHRYRRRIKVVLFHLYPRVFTTQRVIFTNYYRQLQYLRQIICYHWSTHWSATGFILVASSEFFSLFSEVYVQKERPCCALFKNIHSMLSPSISLVFYPTVWQD